ncbi:LysR family transcriptional regulator [Catenulispora sp. NF23]|uniref:LysR family transcriptional regulator n=1 Tax=Catenulispora pinistramenti TaxID=2705254 RepID=UPI001BA9F555|nr:LysR family transcriptional regulator [Catenulispora pinistramenti]MBS2533601.1 LysR family transcriptional regulator [Catenulispora pinistramenti]
MDMTLVGLRVLREVAERGTFTAAAEALGYTQSAVSRQVATLEQATGARLFDRYPGGVRLTSAGQALLRHAVTALEALEAADRELRGAQDDSGRVRLGFFPAAGAVMVARALAALRRQRPHIQVSTREGTTPSLVRALRTGALDLAVLSSRPPYRSPDTDDPPLHVEPLLEDRLLVAVPAGGRFANSGASVTIEQLAGETWIASPAGIDEPLLGVWPGLPGRPRVQHATRDWLTKLHLVAAGLGITTVPSTMLAAVPPGVRLVEIDGVPEERRRVSLVRLPGAGRASVDAVALALRDEAGVLAE